MRIEADAVLPHPRERVFAAYRDEMPAFVSYLPNVLEIEVLERRDEGPVVHLHNVWRCGIELPARLSSALETPNLFSWDDRASWDPARWACDWTIDPHGFGGAVACEGRTEFVAIGDERTRLEMTGELSIDRARLRALPRFLAGGLARTAEAFLLRQIATNLTATCDALATHLGSDTLV